jgi:transcriptional regulator with XRE-family HTH domain
MKRAIIAAQCRAARGLIGWSRDKLAENSGVPTRTLSDFELSATAPRQRTVAAVRTALEAAGVEFTNGDAPGVRLRKPGNR